MGTISKEYFPSNSFALITLWKTTMTFLDFEDQSRVTSGLFPNELVKWRRTRVAVLPIIELARRFDEAFSFVVKLLFPYEVAFGFSP